MAPSVHAPLHPDLTCLLAGPAPEPLHPRLVTALKVVHWAPNGTCLECQQSAPCRTVQLLESYPSR